MSRSSLRGLLATGLVALALPASASAFDEAPCGGQGLLCSHVEVPLDRSGAVPGTLGLDVRRLPAAGAPTPTALVVLLGGPGQVSSGLAEELATELAPLAPGRDIVLFDERGVGGSAALRCPGLGTSRASIGRCAARLGAARGAFTTAADAEDVEAVRQAGDYDQLALYGTSYGTKVALVYAAAHPDRVERVVLDSVVTPEGPDALQLSTFAALPRALRALCAGGACAGITGDPARDLTQLVHRLVRKPLRGRFVTGAGRARRVTVTSTGLLNVLLAGDLDPILRAATPAAIRAANRGDGAPLARLRAGTVGLAGRGWQDEAVNATRYATTICEETLFPWDRGAAASTRLRQAVARIRALPRRSYAPFDAATVAGGGSLPLCLTWPVASAAPGPVTLPPVPTLLLEGDQDLRTPVADAEALAARLGGAAQLVVVGSVGHSVLGSDLSGCARTAFAAFLAGGQVAPCDASGRLVAPALVPPRSLRSVPPYRGVRGAPGRTLTAASRTVTDAGRTSLSARLQGSAATRIGGLRSGYVSVDGAGLHLHRYSYVPGVAVSGVVPTEQSAPVHLRVSGRAAARGTITAGGGRVSGRLGGRRFDVTSATAAAAPSLRRFPPIPALRVP